MLCKYCESLDLDAASDDKIGAAHHESFADLVASADNGCELCVRIVEGADKRRPRRDWNCEGEGGISCSYYDRGSFLSWHIGTQKNVAFLDICAERDDPIGKIVQCRPVSTDMRSEGPLTQMSTWVSTCLLNHSSCHPQSHLRLPTRVIDVGDTTTSPFLFASNGQHSKWVALSYCWGEVVPLRTRSNNMEDFRAQIPLTTLPPLFQDAIHLFRRLGYRYLWIDAICIIQDSDADWLSESAKMNEVFQGAAFTIAAEAAKDSSVGLFRIETSGRNPPIFIAAYSKHNVSRGHVSQGIKSETKPGPLSIRAWTLQEQLLSPCVLRFAEGQMWWQCREAQWNEAYPDSLDRHPERQEWSGNRAWNVTSNFNSIFFGSNRLHNLPELLKCWYATVTSYCKRNITYAKDVFPAISGIVKLYRENGLQNYKAGLWVDDIHYGLLWTTQGRKCDRRRTPYVAPSWSWASVKPKPLSYSYATYDWQPHKMFPIYPLECVAKVDSVSVTPLAEDSFGQIEAGELVITGPSTEVSRNEVPVEFLDFRPIDSYDNVVMWQLETPLDEEEWKLHWSLCKTAPCNIWTVERFTQKTHVQNPCLLFHVASYQEMCCPRYAFCLILEKVPDEENEEHERERLSGLKDCLKRKQSLEAPSSQQLESLPPRSNRKRETGAEDMPCATELAGKAVQYRRIGLAVLQETIPTSTIWSNRTVTIV